MMLVQSVLRTSRSVVSVTRRAVVPVVQHRYYADEEPAKNKSSKPSSGPGSFSRVALPTKRKGHIPSHMETRYSKILGLEEDRGYVDKKADGEEEQQERSGEQELESFIEESMDEHMIANAHALDPELSSRVRVAAWELHSKEPHYWNPTRLANLFKCNVRLIRGILFEGKLMREARAAGEAYGEEDIEKFAHDMTKDVRFLKDMNKWRRKKRKKGHYRPPKQDFGFETNKIADAYGAIFGEVDFPRNFEESLPPEQHKIRKVHNPWYFLPPGVKAGELLSFLRATETRRYREAPRIPARQAPPSEYVEPFRLEPIQNRPKPQNYYKADLEIVDTSPVYNLYNRPILIRERNGRLRTPTYDERCKIHDSQRYLKRPNKMNTGWVWPDDTQPDGLSVKHKAPSTFQVWYTNEEDLNYAEEIQAASRSGMPGPPLPLESEGPLREFQWKDQNTFMPNALLPNQ